MRYRLLLTGPRSQNRARWAVAGFFDRSHRGYGDMVPSSTASRIFSVFVVLLGYGILSLVTASVAAMFVGTQERKVEQEILRDMHREMKDLRQEIDRLRQEMRTCMTPVDVTAVPSSSAPHEPSASQTD